MPRQPNGTATHKWDRDENGTPVTKHGRKLSTKPTQVRNRLRRAQVKNVKEIELLYGKPLAEWTLEELTRGKPKHEDGTWVKGQPAMFVQTPIVQEIKQRFAELVIDGLHKNAINALAAIDKLLTDDSIDYETGKPVVPSSVKLEAAKFVVDHIIGKPKVRVDVVADDAIKSIMAASLVNPDGGDAHPVIDGSVIDYSVDDDDEE